ncbi:MAG: extracellular solute-binding protein [Christensenellales bacterium]
MKKILAAALASVMLVGGAALAAADGELNICSPNSDGLLSIIPVFEEQTGIKVNVESIGTGDCMKRIESEIAQEYSTFDLMYGGSLANYVANAGLFQDYVSEQDQYLMDAYKNTRGYCTNYTIDGSVLLVNTDMLKELGVEVNGYADLLQPELVGKIASADPASSSSAFCQLTNMLLAMGGYEDDAAWKYVEDLFVGQQVAITSGSSAVYKGVYNGEYAVGLTLRRSLRHPDQGRRDQHSGCLPGRGHRVPAGADRYRQEREERRERQGVCRFHALRGCAALPG